MHLAPQDQQHLCSGSAPSDAVSPLADARRVSSHWVLASTHSIPHLHEWSGGFVAALDPPLHTLTEAPSIIAATLAIDAGPRMNLEMKGRAGALMPPLFFLRQNWFEMISSTVLA